MQISKKVFVKIKQKLSVFKRTPQNFSIASGEEFSFHWIFDCPTNSVMKLRNEERVLIEMNSGTKIRLEEHLDFLEKYQQYARLDFVIYCETDRNWVGGVNLVLSKMGMEIGKYIGNEKYLRRGIAEKSTVTFIAFLQAYFDNNLEIIARTKYTNINTIMKI